MTEIKKLKEEYDELKRKNSKLLVMSKRVWIDYYEYKRKIENKEYYVKYEETYRWQDAEYFYERVLEYIQQKYSERYESVNYTNLTEYGHIVKKLEEVLTKEEYSNIDNCFKKLSVIVI